ncbi:ParB N-terminal domain-containing protein [Xanthomonas campestris pv. raphani]|nr:ParB N-terminal domain-containing protein [Xanthomonas campestris pv. raphani]
MTEQQKRDNDTARGVGALVAAPIAAAILVVPEVAGSGGMIAAAKGLFGFGSKEAAKDSAEAVPQLIKTNPRNLIPTQSRNEISGSQVNRMAKDMKRNGFDQSKPVDAVRNERGRLEIVDGHHRTEAARKAAIDEIPVNVWGP